MSEEELHQKARKNVKEYIERMILMIRTHAGGALDSGIDCPECNAPGSLLSGNAWRCRWQDCDYKLPVALIPLSPVQLAGLCEEFKRRKREEEKIAFMRSLFPEGGFDKLFE